MKKTILYLICILSLTLIFAVSCNNSNSVEDLTGSVNFAGDGSRSLSTALNLPGAEDLYWYYTAAKVSGLNTGAATNQRVKEGTGLNAPVGPFSVGRWNFTLRAYASLDSTGTPQYPVYEGTAANVPINAGVINSVNVNVNYIGTTEGVGSVELRNVSFVTASAIKPNKMKIEYKAEGATSYVSTPIIVNASQDGTFSNVLDSVPSNVYQLKFRPMVDNEEQDIPVEKTIIVLNSRKTVISGSLSENPANGSFTVTLPTEEFINGGNGIYFANTESGLNAAILAAQKYVASQSSNVEAKIYIDSDIALNNPIVVSNSSAGSRTLTKDSIAIDLNGSSISYSGAGTMLTINDINANFSLSDSVGRGSLNAVNTTVSIGSGASLTINSGSIQSTTGNAVEVSGSFITAGGNIEGNKAVVIAANDASVSIGDANICSNTGSSISFAEGIQQGNQISITVGGNAGNSPQNPILVTSVAQLQNVTVTDRLGKYYKLLCDLNIEDNPIYINGGSVSIDLNGCTINSQNSVAIRINSNVMLNLENGLIKYNAPVSQDEENSNSASVGISVGNINTFISMDNLTMEGFTTGIAVDSIDTNTNNIPFSAFTMRNCEFKNISKFLYSDVVETLIVYNSNFENINTVFDINQSVNGQMDNHDAVLEGFEDFQNNTIYIVENTFKNCGTSLGVLNLKIVSPATYGIKGNILLRNNEITGDSSKLVVLNTGINNTHISKITIKDNTSIANLLVDISGKQWTIMDGKIVRSISPSDDLNNLLSSLPSSPTTLYLKNGTYNSQIKIENKDLTIIGESKDGVVIIGPSEYASMATISDGDKTFKGIVSAKDSNLKLSNLTIKGNPDQNYNASTNCILAGLVGVNSKLDISDVVIKDLVFANNPGMQNGYGVYLTAANAGKSASFNRCTVENFNKNAVHALSGISLLSFKNSEVIGKGETSDIAQNGIVFWCDAEITNNKFSNLNYVPDDTEACGILCVGQGKKVTIQNNEFTNVEVEEYRF